METFSSITKLNFIIVPLSLVTNCNQPLQQLDVKNTFLNKDLEVKVYIDTALGFCESLAPKCIN
jgi:hypothetical protein